MFKLERKDNKRLDKEKQGSLGGAAVWRLPLAQGAILETWDLIPLPVYLPISLSVTIINK